MLEFFSKSQEYDGAGKAFATKVILVNNEGASVPIFLSAEVIDLPNSELYTLAMDKHYQDNFPQRFEKEKFSEHEQALEENKREISEFKAEVLAGLKDYQERQEEVDARIFSEIEALKRVQKGKAKPIEHSVEIEV